MRHQLDWSIGQRLTLGFGLLLLILGGVMGAVFHWSSDAARAQLAVTDGIGPRADAADEVERSMLYVAISIRRYLAMPQPERLQHFHEMTARERAALLHMRSLPMSPEGRALFAKVDVAADRYLAEAQRIIDLRVTQEIDIATESALAELREAALQDMREFTALEKDKLQAAMKQMDSSRDNASRGLEAASALAGLLFVALALAIALSVRRPAQELVEVAIALRSGDFGPALARAPEAQGRPPAKRNELLKLASAFAVAAEALQKREHRLGADRALAAAAGSGLERDKVAEAALRTVVEHLRAEVGVVYWRDAQSDTLQPIARHALAGAAAVAVGEGIPGQAAKDGRPMVVTDVPRDAPFQVKFGYDQAPPRSLAAYPIALRGELQGVLLVASLRELDAEALSFLDSAAAQLAVGLQNVRAHEEIHRLLDELRSGNERIQAQNEELQAQNEEIQSQSEEIQSQSEELQAQSEELQAQNEELKRKGDDLQESVGALALADHHKNDFLGVLAHELRNPMAPISNSLFVLQRAQPGSEKAERALAVIDRQTRHLTKLIDDLLDVTRISRGKVQIHRERLDLMEVVRACVDDQRPLLEGRKLDLQLRVPSEPVWIRADRTRVAQVLGNLLNNAAKFTDDGGRVTLAVEPDEGSRRVAVRVADTGIGMDAALLARLFQPFTQGASSLDRPNGGLGLGLALVKGLVELHGGTVEAHSDGLQRGTELSVRLPLDEAQPADGAPARAPEAFAGPRRRVLVVEDNVDAANTLREALELIDHQVEVAYSGQEALPKARSFRPEVVLCDLGLPAVDGYEVARRFRADEVLRSVYLVAITGYVAPEDRRRAAEAGFQDHLAKPPDLEQLRRILSELGGAGRSA